MNEEASPLRGPLETILFESAIESVNYDVGIAQLRQLIGLFRQWIKVECNKFPPTDEAWTNKSFGYNRRTDTFSISNEHKEITPIWIIRSRQKQIYWWKKRFCFLRLTNLWPSDLPSDLKKQPKEFAAGFQKNERFFSWRDSTYSSD